MMRSISVIAFTLISLTAVGQTTTTRDEVDRLAGRWIRYSCDPKGVPWEEHLKIPPRLFKLGSLGQRVLIHLPASRSPSSDEQLVAWKIKAFLANPKGNLNDLAYGNTIPLWASGEDKRRCLVVLQRLKRESATVKPASIVLKWLSRSP